MKIKNILKIIILINLVLIPSIQGYCEPVINDYGQIKGNEIIVRAEASKRAEFVGRLNDGIIFEVLDIGHAESIGKWGKHKWFKIRCFEKNVSGWVFGAFVIDIEATEDFSPFYCRISKDNVMMRTKPDTDSPIVKKLKIDQRGFVIQAGHTAEIGKWGSNRWYKIIESNSKKCGWVFGAFVEMTEKPEIKKEVEEKKEEILEIDEFGGKGLEQEWQ